MVFNTLTPTGSTGQLLCSGSDGDPDLGAPNGSCPGGGPGHGPGGQPTRVVNGNTQTNPYANCDLQGNVLIIQESNKNCPDDSGGGGWIIFDFATPTEVDFAGLLDVDEGNTPDFKITHADGSIENENNTPGTGDNGLLKEPLEKNDVSQISIRYHGSGSINNLSYRFCPPTTPAPGYKEVKYDFENGVPSGWSISGGSQNNWRVESGSACTGSKSLVAGGQTGSSTSGTDQSDVYFTGTVPSGVNRMSFQHEIPTNVYETSDKMWLTVGSTVVRKFEAQSYIRDHGTGGVCVTDVVPVSPGQTIKFTAESSHLSEYWKLDEITFFSF